MRPSLSMLPGFERDFDELPSDRTRKLTLQIIADLKQGDRKGQPLDELSHTGDLSDCFKLYFDFPEHQGRPRYRLVYREQAGKYTMVNLEMVAVGKRDNLDAYLRAIKNLNRS